MPELRERLAALEPALLEASRQAVEASAEQVLADTRDAVRVDTGNLRDEAAIRYGANRLTATVGWRARRDWYVAIHEFGTRRIPAQPALGPAIETERGKFAERLRDEIRRALRS
ncbi:HK97-gp10 family putative phage morphogenesis protein [Streptomyces tsukubensis]